MPIMNEFTEKIKELAQKAYILFLDLGNEISVIKEKTVDLKSPKNVLHVFSTIKGYTADYIPTCLEMIGRDKIFTVKRTAKNQFLVHPVLAGLIYHFSERIAQKIEMLSKAYKDVKKRDIMIAKNIRCDLINLTNQLKDDHCHILEMIAKDNPKMKFTIKNARKNFLVVKDVEKGIVEYQIGK